SGSPNAGTSLEMDAIASVVLGGASLSGGRGSILGTLVGVLLLGSLNNGLNLLGVSSYNQMVVKGMIILFAVWLNYIRERSRNK
ncbi:MAG TPA: ABC transporter permease, partial [Mesotoga infera]|nr:ABC transporter permease [Mesotoga infera]